MALILSPGTVGDKFAGKQDAGADIRYEIWGSDRSLAYGVLSNTADVLLAPGPESRLKAQEITLFNSGASTRTVTFYKTRDSETYDGTTQWGASIRLLPGYSAQWIDGQWVVYTSTGLQLVEYAPAAAFLQNYSIEAQGPGFAADTYLIGSDISIPTDLPQVGTRYHCLFDVAKTAAGIATPIITVRFGTAGAVGDAARLTFTFGAQSAVIDTGTIEVWATFRSVGAAGILQGRAQINHDLSVTGLSNLVNPTLQVTSGAFDTSVPESKIGVSVNGGASAAWTVQQVNAELISANL